MRGKIKRIVIDKGFGFIRAGSVEYFFHRSAVAGDFNALTEGQGVEFDESDGQPGKGPRAENVRPD